MARTDKIVHSHLASIAAALRQNTRRDASYQLQRDRFPCHAATTSTSCSIGRSNKEKKITISQTPQTHPLPQASLLKIQSPKNMGCIWNPSRKEKHAAENPASPAKQNSLPVLCTAKLLSIECFQKFVTTFALFPSSSLAPAASSRDPDCVMSR